MLYHMLHRYSSGHKKITNYSFYVIVAISKVWLLGTMSIGATWIVCPTPWYWNILFTGILILLGLLELSAPSRKPATEILLFWDFDFVGATWILAIANTEKIPGCYVSRCYVGSCGGNIVSGTWVGVTGEACTYVYLYWFTFIIVRPAQWQPRKNDPLDYWSQLNVNWKLGNDVSAKIKPRKGGTGTCTICGNHAR